MGLVRVPRKLLVPLLTASVVLLLLLYFLLRIIFGSHPVPPTPSEPEAGTAANAQNISLPNVDFRSSNSLELVLKNRRTRVDFSADPLTLKQLSQLLWAGQGINTDWGDRTSPSAKSTYPINIYVIANAVTGLDQGEYQYLPGDRVPLHQLKPIKKAELGKSLFDLLNQSSFKNAPLVLVVTGDFPKMAEAYGGIPHDREVYLEAGYTAENINLQAESLKLGASLNTNFDELKLKEIITTADTDTIILLIPIGIPK